MYKWIGSSTFPRKDGKGMNYVIYLAEKQPNGEYRPMANFSNGRTFLGSYVPVEVYNEAHKIGVEYGDDVAPSWGPRGQIEGIALA